MTAFVLVHGAWHGGWCWESVQAELAARGHTSVAPDLPITDPAAGAVAYADAVLAALPGRDAVLVAHSLAGLLAPLVAAAAPVRRVVYLAAMLPEPGRSVDDRARAGQRMTRRGIGRGQVAHEDGSTSFRPEAALELLYPDSPPERAAWAAGRLRRQHWRITAEPSPAPAPGPTPAPGRVLAPGPTPAPAPAPARVLAPGPTPAPAPAPGRVLAPGPTPATYVLCTEDRIIDTDWARAAVPDPVELPGDHCPFLSRPAQLADLLVGL